MQFELTAPGPVERLAPLFSSASEQWRTPADLYAALDAEFRFDLDPCPLRESPAVNGLSMSWAQRRVYCNPPYGPGIGAWISKHSEAEVAVYLLPARTDTAWFHRFMSEAREIRFLRGRLAFGRSDGKRDRAPFPSMLMIFQK